MVCGMDADYRMVHFEIHGSTSGELISLEKGSVVPFDIKRVYYIFGAGTTAVRGKHAHRNLSQILVAVSGSVRVSCETAMGKEEFLLDSCDKGLLISGLVWRTMYDFSSDAVLMVVASDYYNENDYIRNYDEFLKLSGKTE